MDLFKPVTIILLEFCNFKNKHPEYPALMSGILLQMFTEFIDEMKEEIFMNIMEPIEYLMIEQQIVDDNDLSQF